MDSPTTTIPVITKWSFHNDRHHFCAPIEARLIGGDYVGNPGGFYRPVALPPMLNMQDDTLWLTLKDGQRVHLTTIDPDYLQWLNDRQIAIPLAIHPHDGKLSPLEAFTITLSCGHKS